MKLWQQITLAVVAYLVISAVAIWLADKWFAI